MSFLYSSRYLGDGATDRREIFYDGRYRSQAGLVPFGVGTLKGSPKSKILQNDLAYMLCTVYFKYQ